MMPIANGDHEMKLLIALCRELLPLLGMTFVFLTIASVFLLAVLGRSFFPEGNLFDILSVLFAGDL